MLRRQKPGEFHNYPEHIRGLGGVVRRLLWRLGFDPLTVYERLAQIDVERRYWKQETEVPTEGPPGYDPADDLRDGLDRRTRELKAALEEAKRLRDYLDRIEEAAGYGPLHEVAEYQAVTLGHSKRERAEWLRERRVRSIAEEATRYRALVDDAG
jgi:hypothetical protein